MTRRRPRKGDRLTYTGPNLTQYRYPTGTIVGFRLGGQLITVELDGGGFADWSAHEVGASMTATHGQIVREQK
jgi:hypothetical protein